MERIPDKIDSKFRFILLASSRAEQMLRGARPKLEVDGKTTRVAMEEIFQEAVEWDYGPAEPEVDEEAAEELAVADMPAEEEAS